MKNFFFTLLLALFAGFSVALTACSDDSDPTPTTGTVTGQITPAASITTVTATNTTTQTTVTMAPTSTGAYTLSNLAPGTYTLSFTPAAGFAAPAPQTVTVTAGATTTATAVTTTTGGSGSGSFVVSGVTTVPTLITANLQFNTNLSITMASAPRTVIMNIDGFGGTTGTFSLATQSANATQLIYSEQVGTSPQQWTTADFLSGGRGTGSIVITAVGTNPRRVSGTFTATAYPAMSTTTGTRTITGSFTDLAY